MKKRLDKTKLEDQNQKSKKIPERTENGEVIVLAKKIS